MSKSPLDGVESEQKKQIKEKQEEKTSKIIPPEAVNEVVNNVSDDLAQAPVIKAPEAVEDEQDEPVEEVDDKPDEENVEVVEDLLPEKVEDEGSSVDPNPEGDASASESEGEEVQEEEVADKEDEGDHSPIFHLPCPEPRKAEIEKVEREMKPMPCLDETKCEDNPCQTSMLPPCPKKKKKKKKVLVARVEEEPEEAPKHQCGSTVCEESYMAPCMVKKMQEAKKNKPIIYDEIEVEED